MQSFSIDADPNTAAVNDRKRNASRYCKRDFIAFFIIGIINNSTYVIMNAGAKEIAPSAVGFVYVCNVVPSFLCKLTGPYWFHMVTYKKRFQVAAICMIVAFFAVAIGQLLKSTFLQFLGIALVSFQAGLGEASVLALSAFYEEPRAVLTGWSSGTGVAGIFGYAWVAIFVYILDFSFSTCLLCSNVLPIAWYFTVFTYLPWPSNINRDRNQQQNQEQGHLLLPGSDTMSFDMSLDKSENSKAENTGTSNGTEDAPLETNVDLSKAAFQMSISERLHTTYRLWKYMIPLFVVYFAEYATQSGTWAAIGLPVSNKAARNKFYECKYHYHLSSPDLHAPLRKLTMTILIRC